MKNRIISISIMLMLIFTSIITTEAIAPTPKVELDEYQLTLTNIENVTIRGTLNYNVGQYIGIYDSTGNYLYAFTQTKKSDKSESFKIQIPSIYLKEGTNTFKIKSLPIRGLVNGSNPKTITINVKSSKKDQTITASNLTLNVNEKKNLNAKVSSGLILTYKSSNSSIATVDANGNVVGRSAGTAKIIINQAGNNEYKAVSKTITVTVKDNSSAKKTYTIKYNANGGKGTVSKQTYKEGQSIKLRKNKFKRSGYTFMGWATSKKGKVVYREDQVVKLKKNLTLYAKWDKDIIHSKKSLTNIAINLAYPYGTSKRKASYKKGKPTPEYKKALNKYYKGQHFWSDASRKGASCDVFVGTVVRSSGYDTRFPAGLGKQIKYMNSSSKWIKVKWDGKKSSLKSGDILYSKHNKTSKLNNGHIYMYVVKDGKGYIANASAKTYYGKIIKYTDRRKLKKVRYVKVFRAKDSKIR